MNPKKWSVVLAALWCLLTGGSTVLAGPEPGDVFREYYWYNEKGDAGSALRVGGKEGQYHPDRGSHQGYVNAPVELPHDLDLTHATRAEVVIEKILCHDSTRGLAIRMNSSDWIAIPESENIPRPQWEYQHHTYPTAVIPLSQLKSGRGNSFQMKVDPEHPWKWPQNLINGVHLRIYYDPGKKAHPRGEITSIGKGAKLGRRVKLQVRAESPNGPIRRVDYVGRLEDVNMEGDGNYLQWHYHFYHGKIMGHLGSATQPPFRAEWDTSWTPDQERPFRIAARIVDETGMIYMTPAVADLTLERPGLSVELCRPHHIPKKWVTRSGEKEEHFDVKGDPSRAAAARLVWSSWSPGYMNGISINGVQVFEREGPRYQSFAHEVTLDDASMLRRGRNVLQTGKTPKYNGKMVHGMEVNWPGIMVLIQYGEAGAARAAPEPEMEGRPNFVLIFIDDQGYQDLGCFGSPDIRTPNLDRMAEEGMKFTDFYSLAPVCSASRAALMTGCYPFRVGITGVLFPRDRIGLNPEEVTVAEVLKTRGYATACIGKWHLGHLPPFLPTNQGFDSYFGIPYSNDMDRVKSPPKKGVQGLDYAYENNDCSFWNVPLLRDTKIEERPANQLTLTRRYTDEAIRFLRKNRDRPFFLYLAHTMPHIPLFATERFKGKSKKGPYGDVIEEIDWSVGEVLKAIGDLGLEEKTLVVYTSDNGPWLSMKQFGGCALPLRDGKFSTYEGGMRMPALVRWPGKVPAGSICSEVAATMDILPTFARLAGAALPPDRIIDGKDITALLLGTPGARSPHGELYYYRGGRLEAVRSGNWKLRLSAFTGRGEKKKRVPPELYDLSRDIGERKNLAPGRPDIVEKLAAKARAFDARLGKTRRQAGKVD